MIRAAIVGYGFSGRRLQAPLIAATPGIEVVAIAARSAEAQALARQEHPAVRVFTSLDELLGDAAALDLVVVATPDSSHFAVAAAALRAGLGVVVDKPLAQTSAQAAELIDLASSAGVLLTSFQNMRWDSDFRTVRNLLDAGTLGAITRFDTRIARWSPTIGTTWREQPRDIGPYGPLADLGSHAVDQAVALFGPVGRVYAEVDRRRPGSMVDDDIFLALTHRGGVRSHVHLGYLTASRQPRFVVQGLDGAFLKYGLDVQFPALAAGNDPLAPDWGLEPESSWGTLTVGGESTVVPSLPGDWKGFYASLVQSFETNSAPVVDPADALHVLTILEAALVSSASGETVEV